MTDYNADFALWAAEQAAKLRAGRVTELDRNNIAEELESLARALRRELVERLARLLQTLLQWEYLDGLRLPVWYAAIQEERSMIPGLLEDAPSLDQHWPEAYAQAWDIARETTCNTTGLAATVLPHECPYSRERALAVTFWPGRGDWLSLADALAQHGDDADLEFVAPRIPPATNIVTLGVDSERVVTARFAAAMKGQAQGSFITFASPELLFQTLTQPRWHIVKAMTGVGPLSLLEVAQRVGRDVEAVHDDVRALLETGVLERTAEGAIVFPYDAVHVDFMLLAG
jgi:predicted transcriptional regulator